ncbi:hypothetical protein IGK32_002249 [Enterococcus sp. DIV1258]
MVEKIRELSKEEFVNQYMFDFKSLIFKSNNPEKITAKQEKLLECEKKIAVLFYETYKRRGIRLMKKNWVGLFKEISLTI